jgi:hypothetical protein
MVGKEVIPKTISRHNKKMTCATKNYFPLKQKKDTMEQLV